MKKKGKLITISVILLMIFMNVFCNTSLAYDWSGKISGFNGTFSNGAVDSTQTVVGTIITITRTIAVGVAIIMITVLAMKYMMAAPGDRADIKKHAVVYVVGAIVLFGSSGILGIIQDFAGSIS